MLSRVFCTLLVAGVCLKGVDQPLFFLENQGEYLVRSGPVQARFTSSGVVLPGGRVEFAGASRTVRLAGENLLPARIHMLTGAGEHEWKRELRAFGAIQYHDLYPGIDVRYVAAGQSLKSDFLVAPEANPDNIRLHYAGFDSVAITPDGRLHVKGTAGEHFEGAPVVYQTHQGVRVPVDAQYVLRGRKKVGFRLGKYDPSLPLVIDPAIVFSTYLGGSEFDSAAAVVTDAGGNIYIAGSTASVDFPRGNLKNTNGGGVDAFVAKMSAAGQLLFAAYLGGRGDDRATSLSLDGNGRIWVAGWTTSTNFPLVSPRQSMMGGPRDAFLAVLSPDGSTLSLSTYLGGSGADQANALVLDSGGSAYLAGETASTDFPVMNALRAASGGRRDAFVMKFLNSGVLAYSTYLGGVGDDSATGIAVDAGGSPVIVGSTDSPNFPSLNAAQSGLGGGQDAFVTKLNAAGSALVFSTWLGGTGGSASQPEFATAVAVDATGHAYVGGVTSSKPFSVATTGAFQSTPSADGNEGFVARLGPSGAVLFFSYLGGSSIDFVTSVVAAADGVLVGGYTASTNFPVLGPLQARHGGNYDAFVCHLSSTGSQMFFGTLLGGSASDAAYAMAPAGLNRIVVAGSTQSVDFPLLSPSQAFNLGSSDAFVTVVRLDSGSSPVAGVVSPSAGSGSSRVFQATFSDAEGWNDIQRSDLIIGDPSQPSASCRFYYDLTSGAMVIMNDAGTASAGSVRPGVVMSAENSRCILYGSESSVAASDKTLTLQFSVGFKPSFAGARDLSLTATDRSSLSSGMKKTGSWTVTAPASNWPSGSAPAPGSVLRVQYADVTGDRRADAIVENAANQFLVAASPSFRPLSVWLQHGATTANQMRYADVNGDGRADALYFDSARSNAVWVSLSTGTGFMGPSPWVQYTLGQSTPDLLQHPDVNGDGRADAVYFDAGRTNAVWVSLSTGSGFTAPARWLTHGSSVPASLQYADVNGDGRADALYFDTFRSGGVWVSLSTGNGFTGPSPWASFSSSTPDQIQYGDVNGDGRADALYFDAGRTNRLLVGLSTGSAFTTPAVWLQHGASTTDHMKYADVNGDGRVDALYFDTLRSGGVWVSLSAGNSFTAPSPWAWYSSSTPDQIEYRDVDGDGRSDAVYFDQSATRAIWVGYSTGTSFSQSSLLVDLR